MENLHSQELKTILKVIKATVGCATDIDALREKILDVLCENLRVEQGIFILPVEDSRFTDIKTRNLEEKYKKQFKAYYHQYDPFHLVRGDVGRKGIVRIEELVSYRSFSLTEYYNDFFRPQEIHHKIVVYLKSMKRLLGMIALFKPKRAWSFSRDDITLLRTVAPYIVHSLEYFELNKKTNLKENLFKAVEVHLPVGLFVFDYSLKLLYTNQKAREFCEKLIGAKGDRNTSCPIPQVLLDDCLALKQEITTVRTEYPVLPKYRILEGPDSAIFSVHSQLLEKNMNSEGQMLFVVSVKEFDRSGPGLPDRNQERVKTTYHLSQREMQIISNVCSGLRNVDIAQKLYISEFTVKKHIQNIFDKMGVSNRSSLIGKVLG